MSITHLDDHRPDAGGFEGATVCRHHHRLKTHTRWSYESLIPGVYLWHDPHDQRFLTNPTGTIDLT